MLETLTEKWIYFLKHAPDLQTIPEIMGDIPEIQQAFAIANQANLSPEELEELEHQAIFIQDQRGAIAQRAGWHIAKANQQGRQEGRQETQREIAQGLLGMMEVEAIAQITGLSL